MKHRFYVEASYLYPLQDIENLTLTVNQGNPKDTVVFRGEEARKLHSLLTGNKTKFIQEDKKMAARRKVTEEKIDNFDLTRMEDAIGNMVEPKNEKITMNTDDLMTEIAADDNDLATKLGYDSRINPSYYWKDRKFEPVKVIQDWNLGFCLGNAIKYIARTGLKGDPIEDLLKARQYLEFEIERLVEEKEKKGR